jgi:hypothetical protein
MKVSVNAESFHGTMAKAFRTYQENMKQSGPDEDYLSKLKEKWKPVIKNLTHERHAGASVFLETFSYLLRDCHQTQDGLPYKTMWGYAIPVAVGFLKYIPSSKVASFASMFVEFPETKREVIDTFLAACTLYTFVIEEAIRIKDEEDSAKYKPVDKMSAAPRNHLV